MKTGRGATVDEEGIVPDSKRHRVAEDSSPSASASSLPSENPLHNLANYEDDDEEVYRKSRALNGYNNEREAGINGQQNDGRVGGGEILHDSDSDSEDEEGHNQGRRSRTVETRRDCPYLDTVNRQVLDFDFEKFCSVSLSNLNVYACLVCGKYYQGRGKKSHAYTHSLEAGHHVYINLQTEKVYCLPDGYEINDPSLDDIRHVLNPRFTREQVGLNNIKETDFVNVTIQSLMRVTPLRNFFLIPENYQHCKSPLVHRFGELTRKIWHARNFKGQVSPHEFLQAVMKASKKRFRIGVQSDPVEFMSWVLNTLHADLRSSKKDSSIIYQCFQGELEVVKEVPDKAITEKKEISDEQNRLPAEGGNENKSFISETSRMPFLMLGLDLPPPPLFKDVMEKNIIPQVPLFNILKKFDGEAITEVVRPHIARMRYRNLELKDYIPLPSPKENEQLRSKYEMQDLHVSETLPQMVALSEAYMQIYEQHK
ncbi:hypothetical protein CRG98_000177 [Punica granatum]|uniref:U4/U6.U5 tri-snRNP-associated protein 2-like n=1 Tax=Punica granatum TaxID=22663 RepID=A0A2I0LFJ4_PUNGR|nr:hypothetical protein CRG98_000177 [Punica granatum]